MAQRGSMDGPSCRRRLFAQGESDQGEQGEGDQGEQGDQGDNLHNELREQLRLASQAAARRWNFDFQQERPLEGPWQWEAVGPPPPPDAAPTPPAPAPPAAAEDTPGP
ncbi:cyclin-dependent kinase inhibitor 1B-like isoform X2 [Bacillus rossius redtenbacheri]|uniref:cyclin-dependent kinase inhibitor 1B-like isoform X2 n=1 Tax=Bacillus rossius redtenbacheri TaxID=93214 RepID=UPI002FDD2C0F